jgi:hypothetical protein
MLLRRFIAVFVLAALAVGHGLHLPLWQVVAWSGMLVSYSRDNALSEAVAMTFDGEHPCPMCVAIEKAQAETAHDRADGIEQRTHREVPGITAAVVMLATPPVSLSSRPVSDTLLPAPVYFPPPSPPPIHT